MFKRILVPLDGSSRAEAILGRADSLLRLPETEVVLLRVTDVPTASMPHLAEADLELNRRAREYVASIKKFLIGAGIRAHAVVAEGPAAEAILDTAERESAASILMSTHGLTGLSRWVFGSVTEKVLRSSPVPLIILRSFPRDPSEGDPGPIGPRRILVPIDESEVSLQVLPKVIELAKIFNSHVYLANVLEHESAFGPASSRMESAFAQLKEAGVSGEPILRKGDSAEQILEAADDTESEFIALGTHGRSGPSRWMLGSVTEKVVRNARVPLLVVRQSGRQAKELRPPVGASTVI